LVATHSLLTQCPKVESNQSQYEQGAQKEQQPRRGHAMRQSFRPSRTPSFLAVPAGRGAISAAPILSRTRLWVSWPVLNPHAASHATVIRAGGWASRGIPGMNRRTRSTPRSVTHYVAHEGRWSIAGLKECDRDLAENRTPSIPAGKEDARLAKATVNRDPAYQARLDHFDRLIRTIPGLERKGAANPYTSLNGHMFSYLHPSGSMALRLPPGEREAFITRFQTALFHAYGIVQKEYVTVPDSLLEDTEALGPYFKLSYEFVARLKAKPTSKESARAKSPSKSAMKNQSRPKTVS
jgi:hypothetical protein